MARYEYTDDMAEISGFGGGYESTCRKMVVAGLEHLHAHSNAAPRFSGNPQIYGIISEDNDDATELTKAVVDAADGDCTGAMHQAAISHILWIQRNGWDRYCAESRERHAVKGA